MTHSDKSIIPDMIIFERYSLFGDYDISKAKCPIDFVKQQDEKIVEETSKLTANTGGTGLIKATANDKNEETTNMTNYQLNPLYHRIYFNRDGKVDYEKNELEVRIVIDEFGSESSDTFRINYSDIDKITKIIGRRYPNAILYNKKYTESIVNDFRKRCGKVQIIRCYTEAGWQIIDNKYVYLHKGISKAGTEVTTSLMLPFDKSCTFKELENIWRKSLTIYKDYDVSTVLCLYSFLGISYRLFDKAGFPPHFLLFMTGKTGSFKTTIAKLLYTQLVDESYRDYPRRIDADTVTSFERALVVSGVDTITLIDDYSPAKSHRGAEDMANKLESIIRMVGDGSTKSRSNVALEDCRGKGVKGMVVLTGELQGKGLSSNLRCLYCEIERDKVDLETVTWFQSNNDYYCTFIQHFVWFLAEHWENLILYIQKNFERYRRVAEQLLDARRLIDVVATLYTVSDFLRLFLIAYCKLPQKTIDSEIINMKTFCKLLEKKT